MASDQKSDFSRAGIIDNFRALAGHLAAQPIDYAPLKVSPIKGAGGAKLLLREQWCDQARDLKKAYAEEYYALWVDKTRKEGPTALITAYDMLAHMPAHFAEFIALERKQAQGAAEFMIVQNTAARESLASGRPVPLMYGADSGIHTAVGFAAGLLRVEPNADIRVFPKRMRDEKVADAAMHFAAHSGAAIFCDSTIFTGGNCFHLLDQMAAGRQKLDTLIYANFASISRRLDEIQQFHAANLPGCLSVGVSSIDPRDEWQDRADMIAYADHPETLMFRPLLLKRKMTAQAGND